MPRLPEVSPYPSLRIRQTQQPQKKDVYALPVKSGERKNEQQSLPLHRQPIQPTKVQKEEDTSIHSH